MNILARFLPVAIIMLSGFLVAIADGLIKHASIRASSIWNVLRNPVMIPIAAIYVFAILAFSYAFIKKWDLGIIGIMQIVVYSAAVIAYGLIVFNEQINLVHGLGIMLAILAAILMSI